MVARIVFFVVIALAIGLVAMFFYFFMKAGKKPDLEDISEMLEQDLLALKKELELKEKNLTSASEIAEVRKKIGLIDAKLQVINPLGASAVEPSKN